MKALRMICGISFVKVERMRKTYSAAKTKKQQLSKMINPEAAGAVEGLVRWCH